MLNKKQLVCAIQRRLWTSLRVGIIGVSLFNYLPVTANEEFNELPGYLITQKQIATVSSPSEFTTSFVQNESWQTVSAYSLDDLKQTQLVIVNTSNYLSKDEIALARAAYRMGKTVIIDNTAVVNNSTVSQTIAAIIGIGLTDPIVAVRRTNGKAEYKSLSVNNELSANEQTEYLITEVKNIISTWDNVGNVTKSSSEKRSKRTKRSALAYSSVAASSSEGTNYRPEVTIPLEFRHVGFKCRVGDEFEGNGFTNNATWNSMIEDACDGKASVSLFYNIDFVRSVPFNGGGDNNADNAKYVRITLNPGDGSSGGGSASGGAGWHLVDKPTHKHTWFESWTNRITWFGPVAIDYGVEVIPSDNDVHLYHTTPNNKPKESEIREVTGITIGVEAGGKAEVGEKGPTVGVDAKGSFSYNSQRWVSYKAYEYTIENQSRAGSQDRAKWVWDRKFEEDSENWRVHGTCPLWCSDWFFKDSSFTAASYANYKPGFSATFRVSADKRGQSRFTINNRITVAALGGRVQYAGLAQVYTPWAYKGSKYTLPKVFTVNWEAPVFEPEINVSIEAYKYASSNGVCLDVQGNSTQEGAAVVGYDCHYANNQLWGLDQYQRYKSRVTADRCLTAESDGTLTVKSCSAAANQKWRWEGDSLKSELGDKSLAIVGGQVKLVNKDSSEYQNWKNYVRNIEPERVMTVNY
ncbi:leukocidin family pore-forming toxin [Zooshikella sp. RANM57]|uniref:leukocidin family pore-forming toxin n=1 Tax=Zooshikella sp. RANM57 TaxID=3425863 RepID=UPI003D6FA90D